ncbi:hypothetical protein AQUSIP_15980 [Aquicella siphonis]|uniref:Uncharacterized protein n=1 Tax=Aquicella siphonis TaxID=254247 RepID=A0A5E4PH28_9COXI|nr:thaumatin family protein [Aquicella siphonis]VVC76289.1 hypothetical protein AQUSIP_15980 [Aquicella siphonis]
MKWLRYCIVVLSFILFSPVSNAGEDPIGWTVSGGIPSQTVANLVYPTVTYTFTNNMPFQMITPLYIVRNANPASEFNFSVDTCSGVRLTAAGTIGSVCTVTFSYRFLTLGQKSISLSMQYGKNVVPLPAMTTNVGAGPSPLVTGTVTIPLPANMGAGDQAPFEFTYTNTNNGAVTDVTSLGVNINPNPGGGMFIGPVTDTCGVLPGAVLPAGGQCTISGTFQAGTPGTYTLNSGITYLPGAVGLTALTSTTNATVQVTGEATIPLPANMGAGESQPVEFTFTNNSTLPTGIVTSVTVTPVGGTFTPGSDTCTGFSLAGGASCVVSGTFDSGVPGAYSVTADFNYPGGTVSVTTTSTGTVKVTSAATTPLPNDMGAGEEQPVVFTFTNTGTGTINGITAASTGPEIGGTFTADAPTATTCGPGGLTSLAPNQSCILSGTFATGLPGSYSLTASFNYDGGSGVAPVTTPDPAGTSTVKITGTATVPLPPGGMGAGEQQPVEFTFTNTGTGTVYGITAPSFGPVVGGTFTPDAPTLNVTCGSGTKVNLAAGTSCTYTGVFASGAPGSYSLTASFNYAGGMNVAPTPTTSSGTILLKVNPAVWNPALPASIGTGEEHTIAITYTNTGTGTAYGITDPTAITSLNASGGTCTSATTSASCAGPYPITLASGATCSIQCTFEATVAGTASASSSITYAAGTTTAVTTTSTASVKVTADTPIPLPSSTNTGITYPVTFTFYNGGTAAAQGAPTTPPVSISPGPSTQLSAPTYMGCVNPLPSGQTCVVSVDVTPAASGDLTVYSLFTYDGGNVLASTSTSVAFARTFTINNYCGKDIWFAFSGAEVRKGCSDKSPCPTGSMCNAEADNGKGVCYWKNPVSDKNDFHLGPMTGTTPSTAKVMIPDLNKDNQTIWSGSLAGRTGCSGKQCETADCGSGDKTCPPGNRFSLPATTAQFTLMRDAADHYAISAGNGINVSMSMGPTHPDKTTPAYDASSPYYCATPGSADASRIFSACSWVLNPPGYPNAGSAVDYAWVKPGVGGACSTNACPGSEVCGLSYNNGKFARVCGTRLGYWTAAQACLLNSASASAFFDCNNAMNQPAGELLSDLNVCTNAAPQSGQNNQPPACAGAGNKERAAMVQWIKSACPSLSAFAGDTANSSFTCATNEKTKSKKDDEVKVNVTEYTISFCPELAPNSPFRNAQRQ